LLAIKIPADEVRVKRVAKLKEWSKKVKLDGFRPGKVPYSEIVKRFEKSAHQDVLQFFIEEGSRLAMDEAKLNAVSQPKVEVISDDIAGDLQYNLTFERTPDVKLTELSKLKIKKPLSEVPAEVVDEAVLKVREQYGTYEVTSKPASCGDEVTIDFNGFLDGKPFAGGSAEDYKVVLGQGKMLIDFENAVMDKVAGDEVQFPLTFPKDYHSADLAGKTVDFAVKIKAVAKGDLPELDEEFFKKLQCKPATLEVFSDQIKQPLQDQLEGQLRLIVKERIFTLLTDKHKFQLPESHVDGELSRLELEYKKTHQGESPSVKEQKKLQKQAAHNVKLGFLLHHIIRVNDITLDENLVQAEIAKLGASYDDLEMFSKWYKEDKARLEGLHSQVLETQVVDWLLSQLNVQEETVAYSKVADILNKER